MATVTEPRPARAEVEEPRFLIRGLGWEQYGQVVAALGRTGVRCTYDSGVLELMSPSPEHESYREMFGMAVRVLAEAFGIPVKSLGNTTLRRKLIDKGLEPDACFYLAHWPMVRGKKRLDLTIDPPPDLAVEIDVTSSSLDRLPIYAGLGVPEIWRLADDSFSILLLREDRTAYDESPTSPTFPGLAFATLMPLVEAGLDLDDGAWTEAFRAWVVAQRGREG